MRLTPDQQGKYETGRWSSSLNMKFAGSDLRRVFWPTAGYLSSVARIAATRPTHLMRPRVKYPIRKPIAGRTL